MMNFYGGKKAAGENLPPPDAHEDTKQVRFMWKAIEFSYL